MFIDRKVIYVWFVRAVSLMIRREFGKHLITNEYLEIGQIIEEAFCVALEYNERYSYCANCFESKGNLMPFHPTEETLRIQFKLMQF